MRQETQVQTARRQMPIHSATFTTDGIASVEVLPDDRSRRWYIIQSRSSVNTIVGGESLQQGDPGLFLNAEFAEGEVMPANGGRLEVKQGHEFDRTPCHSVRIYGEGGGGPVYVVWATEDSTD